MNQKQIQHQQPPPPSSGGRGGGVATAAAASPPSSSSSPSHEFSFTISLQNQDSKNTPDKTKPTPPSLAIDLSPADDIFFHGHLLPLHLLSHFPVSPRSSTNSIDSFILPITDSLQHQNTQKPNNQITQNHDVSNHHHHHHETKEKPKSKSFSLFGLPKWRKGYANNGIREKDENEKQSMRKLKFDVSQVVKRYIRMVRPFLSFGNRKDMQFHRQSYSYSGNLSMRSKKEIRGRRGDQYYSAPASMITSPTNSGLLVATPTGFNSSSSSSSDSTMEELQAAIQAAIAHCKKSIAIEGENNQMPGK